MIFQATLTLAFSPSNLLNDSSNDCVKYNAYIYRERILDSVFHFKTLHQPKTTMSARGLKAQRLVLVEG